LTSDEGATSEPESASELTSTLSIGVPGGADVEVPDLPVTDPDQAAVDSLPAGSALLVVRRGPNAGSRFTLDVDLVTAGRHPESDIFLDDVTVSRRHAQFVRTDRGYLVKDVGSLNGTYVNRQRIDQVALSGGDEVQIGKYRLIYLIATAGGGGRS
jgi:pSer/pThr/pTyr-binding forkhead associated (FHA) protein